MDYLLNSMNLVRDASLDATAVDASTTIEAVELDSENAGGGTVALTGSYTAAADATFDIEITEDAGSTPRVSAIAVRGVGNATMDDLAVESTVAAQTFTVRLEDLGTLTRAAYVPFQSVTLQARETGSDGNSITLAVDSSGLTATPTTFATRGQMTAGQTEFKGSEWNFGAVNLEPDGTVPASAPRIRFGDDPHVYRQFRKFVAGNYVYGFSPTLVADIPSGTRVKLVTGSYAVTISDGVTDNELSSIVTLYDCLLAIRAYAAANPLTALVEVVGNIGNYRMPGQQGVIDLNVFTLPYIARTTVEGSSAIRSASIGLTADSSAPTETLEITCIDTTRPGLESWGVTGDVSGSLANAITGALYAAGAYSFTIPNIPAIADPVVSRIYADIEPARAGVLPCVDRPRVGINARGKTYTFVYTARGTCSVNCSTERTEGGPSPSLLGTDVGGESMGTIPAPLQVPLAALYDWKSTFVEANTGLLVNSTTITGDASADPSTVTVENEEASTGLVNAQHRVERVSAILKADRIDINAAKSAVSIFHNALRTIYEALGEPETIPTDAQTEWDAALVDLETDFGVIDGNVGADFWRKFSTYVAWGEAGAGAIETNSQAYGTVLLTQEFELYLERYTARMHKVLTLAGVEPPFDLAAGTGGAVWRDIGGDWWVSRDGLLPLFTGVYYHACRMETDATGRERPVSTKEFGIGVTFPCGGPQDGDRLLVTVDVAGTVRSQYQQGDKVIAEITRASPVEFGGGQTGTDTYKYSVIGSVVGELAEYELALGDDPGTLYDDGGVSFRINLGGIVPALGDSFTFDVEKSQWRWRKDAGSWSAAADITTSAVLSDGLSVSFTAGAAPSWVAGDAWQFSAIAVNGYDNLRQPTQLAYSWTSATQLTIAPLDTDEAQAATFLSIVDHTIPSDATITLQGSNDNFSSIPLNVTVPWSEGYIAHTLAQGYAKLRLIVNRGGRIVWAYLGQPHVMKMSKAGVLIDELGNVQKTYILPSFARRGGYGIGVDHTAVTFESLETLREGFEHAALNDESIIGVRHNGIVSLVTIPAAIAASDIFTFHPTTDKQRLNVSLNLEPVR